MVTIAFQPALARARAALERGRHGDAIGILTQALKASGFKREDELGLRFTLAEAWLMADDVAQAAAILGRPPDSAREDLPPALLSTLWRLHGRIAYAKGDQSRAIALLGRALRHAEQAHDSEAIGLAHYELGHCYKQVGDTAIIREHIAKAAPALHAAGNRRYLALLHSLSGVVLAQGGRVEEAMAALRQAERLAASVHAHDVLGIVLSNQANVALIQHSHEQALALAERSATVQEQNGPGRGLAISLANLGQILVRLGKLERAEKVLLRALESRGQTQFNEITGAVYDSLAQIALMRGGYEAAGDYLRQAGEAYGSYGAQTDQWYEWSIRVLEAKLAARRGATEAALRLANEIAAKAPPAEAIQADLIACEALLAGGHPTEAETRMGGVSTRIDARAMPAAWGEFLRLRGALHAAADRLSEAYHDIAQSASVFELIGEGYQRALEPFRARPPREPGRRPLAGRAPVRAGSIDVRIAWRRARPRRNAEGRVPAAVGRSHRPSLVHRCGRCGGAAAGRCGGVSRTARPRDGRRRSRHARRRLRRGVRRAAGRRPSTGRMDRRRRRSRAGDRHARRRPIARHGMGDLPADGTATSMVPGSSRFSRRGRSPIRCAGACE